MEAIWKPVQGYEDLYEISSFGEVRSKDRIVYQMNRFGRLSKHIYKGRTLKPQEQENRYMTVDLHKNGMYERFFVHRLVGLHFIEKPAGKDCINHLDANPKNNTVQNLEWCTQSENILYAYNKGTMTPPNMRKVAQYDLEGNLLKVWKSQKEAERQLGISQPNIYKVCAGKREKAGGYKWKYIE